MAQRKGIPITKATLIRECFMHGDVIPPGVKIQNTENIEKAEIITCDLFRKGMEASEMINGLATSVSRGFSRRAPRRGRTHGTEIDKQQVLEAWRHLLQAGHLFRQIESRNAA